MSHTTDIAQLFDVYAELSNSTFSPAARDIILSELASYPDTTVHNALCQCARQGQFTLPAILQQLDTHNIHNPAHWYALIIGAWQDESRTIIVPQNAMAAANDAVLQLFRHGDHHGARQLFSQNYQKLNAHPTPVKWCISLGFDLEQRRTALQVALDAGQISSEQMQQCLPHEPHPHTPLAPHIQNLLKQSKI